MGERPFYRIIAEQIERRICSGQYSPNVPLPTEPLLEKEFGVSRITVRQALALLKQRGVLYSRSGKGTLIRPPTASGRSMTVTGSISDLAYYAAETAYRPIERVENAENDEVRAILRLKPAERMLYMSGTRGHANDKPFAFEEIYCPLSLGAGIDNANLRGRTVFALIEELHGVVIATVRQEISVVSVPPKAKYHLRLKSGQSVLLTSRYYQSKDDSIVEVAHTFYAPDSFKYVTTLYRE